MAPSNTQFTPHHRAVWGRHSHGWRGCSDRGNGRFGSEALAAAGTSNLKLPRVYRVSGGELDLDAARIGATVGDMKACLSQVYETPVYLQRILSGGMELSECTSLAELIASG